MTFYEQQCAAGILGNGLIPCCIANSLGLGFNPCPFCIKDRNISEMLNDAERLADSLRKAIDANDKQNKFLNF